MDRFGWKIRKSRLTAIGDPTISLMAVSCPSWSQPARKKRAQSTVEHMLCPHQTVCLLLQQAQVYHLSLKA